DRGLIEKNLAQIQKQAAHIPKYWSVRDKARTRIAELFDNVKYLGTSVVFKQTLSVDSELEKAELLELAEEMGRKGDGKTWLLEDNTKLVAVFGAGGSPEAVKEALDDAFNNYLREK